mmetsp:Transcript_18577/g.44853  ORF Transcript_18577/g.44853 Transcript_18577/m.44853 type:complete len:193 (+) Transcript_18577:82-660(+)
MMISSPPSKQQQQFPQRQKSRVIPIKPWSNHGRDNNNSNNNMDDDASDDIDDDNVDRQPQQLLPPPDYAMIELNGELLPPVQYPTIDQCRTVLGNSTCTATSSSSSSSAATTQPSAQPAVELGQLQLDGEDETPVMILGSHQLKGKIEKLKEPFCLMEKVYNKENQSLEAYQVVGIVKQKYLFSQYPKVIMR